MQSISISGKFHFKSKQLCQRFHYNFKAIIDMILRAYCALSSIQLYKTKCWKPLIFFRIWSIFLSFLTPQISVKLWTLRCFLEVTPLYYIFLCGRVNDLDDCYPIDLIFYWNHKLKGYQTDYKIFIRIQIIAHEMFIKWCHFMESIWTLLSSISIRNWKWFNSVCLNLVLYRHFSRLYLKRRRKIIETEWKALK